MFCFFRDRYTVDSPCPQITFTTSNDYKVGLSVRIRFTFLCPA